MNGNWEERKAVTAADSAFFNKELNFDFNGERLRILDLCRILPQINGKPVQSYINRIYVPSDRYEQTLAVLQEDGLPVEKIVAY